MYTATSPDGPWTSGTATVTGHDALGLVDMSPLLRSDGSILMYYLMSYQNTTDPASSQPGNQWKIGVAESTDQGQSFTHRAVAYTHSTPLTDPFPLVLDSSGTIRLFASPAGPSVLSATSTDSSGRQFTLDSGIRATVGGVPGALKIGSTYFLYVNGMEYFTSSDALNFVRGGSIGLSGGSPSPIIAADGTYVMSYVCPGGGTDARSHTTCVASSTDGRTWTQRSSPGAGSVPGLVQDSGGRFRIYASIPL
jgi:hypothetical protein